MFWVHYGRWEDGRVLNAYGQVIYESPEALKLRNAVVFGFQLPPAISDQNKVPQDTFKTSIT